MIYYFLPDRGIFGGVKVACQFVELLNSLEVPAVVALPDGQAPQWFQTNVAVVREEEAIQTLNARDWIMITWPPDHQRLKRLPGKMVCHCQGTDPLIDPILADSDVTILTCWEQASRYVREKFARGHIEVSISISDCFFFDGVQKLDNVVAYMPRRGFPIARACIRACGELDFIPIDGLAEAGVSQLMKRAGIFLATSVGEWFGLPALEAMAAGCLLVSVPVIGGMEYLEDGKNCLLAKPEEMPERLRWITRPENAAFRARLRSNAAATAVRYRVAHQRQRLRQLLDSELRIFLS